MKASTYKAFKKLNEKLDQIQADIHSIILAQNDAEAMKALTQQVKDRTAALQGAVDAIPK